MNTDNESNSKEPKMSDELKAIEMLEKQIQKINEENNSNSSTGSSRIKNKQNPRFKMIKSFFESAWGYIKILSILSIINSSVTFLGQSHSKNVEKRRTKSN